MATYAQWLKQKGLTSTKQNAAKWKKAAGQPTQPASPQAQPAPYSYAAQVARDPLSIPFDSSMVWQGKGRPNLASLASSGYGDLTPIQRPDGGWAVFGLPTDPTPQWIKDQAGDITKRGQKVQDYAQGTVAPWLSQQMAALGNVQGQAQTNFANLIGQSSNAVAGAAAGAGPGANYADAAALAPFQTRDALGDQLGQVQAKALTGGAAYQGAVDTLQGAGLGAGLASSFAQTVAAMPDKWEEQRQAFMRSMNPVITQIQQFRASGEQNRLSALEQRRQFNAQNAVEREVAGLKAQADVATETIKSNTTLARDQARADQDQAKVERDQYRTLAQVTADVGKGDALLDNHGAGFSGRPAAKKYHGKTVTWERAQNGKWYGIARAGAAGSGSGSGSGGSNGGENIYASSTTRDRLSDDLLSHWQGVDPDGSGPLPATPGWSTLALGQGVADPKARQVALWIAGNQQFLKRGGKLRDTDLRQFLQSVLPGVDYSRVRVYLNKVL